MLNALAINALASALIITGLWLRLRSATQILPERPAWYQALTLFIAVAVLRCLLAFALYAGLFDAVQTRVLFGVLIVAIAVHLPIILDAAAALLDQPMVRLSRLFWGLSVPAGVVIAIFGVIKMEQRTPNWVSADYIDAQMNNLGGLLTLLVIGLYIAILRALARTADARAAKVGRIITNVVLLNIAVLIHDTTVALQGLNNPYLSIIGMVVLAIGLTLAAERLADDQIDELTRSTHEAEARAEARTSFLSHMSHQVRTPLTEIRGLQYLLQERAKGRRQAELAEALGTSAEILRTLIDDLLDYESIDAGLLELDERPFSPRQLHDDLRQFVELLPRPAEVLLKFDYDGAEELFLVGDVARLRQILLNLSSNALKFTARGSVSLRVRARTEGDRCKLLAEVEDSGIGINPERSSQIFNSFVQGESGTSKRYEGSGLGLAISKRLSDLMGAQLEFESVPDEGTLFRLQLELPVLTNDAERPAGAHGEAAAPDVEALTGTRVLVVEDTPTNLLITRLLLEEMGCHVATASEGMEAIEVLTSTAQHVVLMDLQMAPWDGFETTRRIRKAEDYEQLGHSGRIPIIAVTADVSPLARKQADSAGCDAFLAKPFTRQELITALWRELPRIPQGGRELTGQPSVAPISASLLLQAAHGQQGLAIKRLEGFQRQIVALLHDLQSPQAGAEAKQTQDLRRSLSDAEELGLGEIGVALSELLVAFTGNDQERSAALLERCWEAHRELERRTMHIRQSFETAAYPRGKTQEFPDLAAGDIKDD